VHRYSATFGEVMHYYNVAKEDQEEDEYPRNVKIPENEGEHAVEGPHLESARYAKPLRTCKVNIGTYEKPKFANIGDYWNDETVEKIADLLHEHKDLFSITF
jgi:hypothetical protein